MKELTAEEMAEIRGGFDSGCMQAMGAVAAAGLAVTMVPIAAPYVASLMIGGYMAGLNYAEECIYGS
ncbi:MAG: hypothetical protein GF372_12875 [Candidatus Marinimicrobia bacterium]|nr:hypothetical protein [Candidatus Neomarinimicrobiota bacterium]